MRTINIKRELKNRYILKRVNKIMKFSILSMLWYGSYMLCLSLELALKTL